MNRRKLLQTCAAMPVFGMNIPFAASETTSSKDTRVYELRIYHVHEGKLDDLLKRFREHTVALFDKHGLKSVAYWTALDEPLKGRTLIYILEHPSRESATANWAAFQADPEWRIVKAASEAGGPIVDSVDSHFMTLTDFSPRR